MSTNYVKKSVENIDMEDIVYFVNNDSTTKEEVVEVANVLLSAMSTINTDLKTIENNKWVDDTVSTGDVIDEIYDAVEKIKNNM